MVLTHFWGNLWPLRILQCLNTEAVCQLALLSTNYFAVEVIIQHLDDVDILLRKPVTSKTSSTVSEHWSCLSFTVDLQITLKWKFSYSILMIISLLSYFPTLTWSIGLFIVSFHLFRNCLWLFSLPLPIFWTPLHISLCLCLSVSVCLSLSVCLCLSVSVCLFLFQLSTVLLQVSLGRTLVPVFSSNAHVSAVVGNEFGFNLNTWRYISWVSSSWCWISFQFPCCTCRGGPLSLDCASYYLIARQGHLRNQCLLMQLWNSTLFRRCHFQQFSSFFQSITIKNRKPDA